jgi:hypothetical protein
MVKHQTNAFVQLMQAFILSHTIEILALTTVIIILIFIIKQIWQRRLGYQTIMGQKEEDKTIKQLQITLQPRLIQQVETWEIVNVKMEKH